MGPSVSFPLPPRIAKKLLIRNSRELISGKLPIPLPIFYYFDLIREVLANTLYVLFASLGFAFQVFLFEGTGDTCWVALRLWGQAVFLSLHWLSFSCVLSAPNRAIWLRSRFVIRIANRKSLAIWNTVNLLRKAHCSDYLYRKTALRF